MNVKTIYERYVYTILCSVTIRPHNVRGRVGWAEYFSILNFRKKKKKLKIETRKVE